MGTRTSNTDASCLGKIAYPNYWQAKKGRKNLNKNREKAKANVYKCGNHWHVGNTMGKYRERRISRHEIREQLNGRGKFSI